MPNRKICATLSELKISSKRRLNGAFFISKSNHTHL
jgi:hypothetical protein